MPIEKILIVGAGAIGGSTGFRLIKAGYQTFFLIKSEDSHDLQIKLYGETKWEALPPSSFITSRSLKGNYDLAILAVKSYDTETTLKALNKALKPRGLILSLQNGVGNEELLLGYFPSHQILGGIITTSVSHLEKGKITEETSGGIGIAPYNREIKDVFSKAGYRVNTYPDYRPLKWNKLLLNIWGNAISAILDMDIEEIYKHPRLFHIDFKAYKEATMVMRALRLPFMNLPGYPLQLFQLLTYSGEGFLRKILYKKFASGRGSKEASLRIDLKKHKEKTEAPYLYGQVARYGRILGIDTPINQHLFELTEGIARKIIPWEKFRGKESALLSYLEGTFL